MIKIKNSFFNLKFRYQLLITYIILSLIPVLTLGFFSFNQSKSLLESSKEKDINFYFEKSTIAINEIFNSCEQIVFDTVKNESFSKIFINDYDDAEKLKNDVTVKLEPYFYNLKRIYPFIREITFYSNKEIEPYRTVIHNYKSLIQPTNRVKTPMHWYYNGKFIVLKYDIYDSNNKVTGSLCIFIWPKVLMNSTNPQFMNYNLLLTTSEFDFTYEHTISCDVPKPDANQLRNLTGTQIILNSKKYLILTSDLKNNYKLYAYVDNNEVVDGSDSILHSTIIVLTLCFIGVLVVTFIFSLSLTKRIRLLAENMSLAKKGNLKVELKSNNKDEIGTLTNDFSDMIKRIDNLIETVYQSEISQRKAELKALQAQINPHFLYNTLQTINWLAIENDAPEINSLVIYLSHFYRNTLNINDENSNISQELDIVKSYLDIQKIVLGNTFDVVLDVEPSILSVHSLHLILQPLVENAIEHGIRKLRDKRGLIEISATIQNDNIILSVSDNGPGIKENDSIFKHHSKGYGLRNVNERIKLKYGTNYGIRITSYGNPTTFTIEFPF